MALTRKFLSALGIEQEKIDEIIENHTQTVDALKEERDKYKVDAEKLPGIQKELDDLKEAAGKDGENPYKAQYDDLKREYDDYKADVETKAVKARKVDAYRKLLKDAKVSEKRIDAILRVSNVDGMELNEDGSFKNAEDLKKDVEKEWSDFIVKDAEKGADTNTPPEGNGGGSGRQPSRAAQLAASYMKNLYGTDAGKGDGE